MIRKVHTSPIFWAFLATLVCFMTGKTLSLGDSEMTVLSGMLGWFSRDLLQKDPKDA